MQTRNRSLLEKNNKEVQVGIFPFFFFFFLLARQYLHNSPSLMSAGRLSRTMPVVHNNDAFRRTDVCSKSGAGYRLSVRCQELTKPTDSTRLLLYCR